MRGPFQLEATGANQLRQIRKVFLGDYAHSTSTVPDVPQRNPAIICEERRSFRDAQQPSRHPARPSESLAIDAQLARG